MNAAVQKITLSPSRAIPDLVTPVLAGLILGQAFYRAWIGVLVAIAMTGAIIERARLRSRDDPEAVATMRAG